MKKSHFVEKDSTVYARPFDIFKVLLDFGQWKNWTPSITDMSIMDHGRAETGASIRIVQPKLPDAVWTLTEIDYGKSLTLEKRSFGLRMISEHLIVDNGQSAKVTIRMRYEGPLGGFFYRLTRSLTDRYMTMEINGLKRASEIQG